ncbi:MAG: RpiB/LacA/LacB family sugar-phosphate isomerase [bacterium]|nr:RpiB/LacA/LacB family sugar-phosphate isomerase [bacterium]
MQVYIASDHAGFKLKEKIKNELGKLGFEVKDFGPFSYDKDDDYPDFVRPVAEAVASDSENSRGIILGASGQGEAILANRFKNVRAVVFFGDNLEIIKLSREHNNANVLSLGAHFLSEEEAKVAVKLWLETPFSGEERHIRRIRKIDQKESC